jgi:hypothetical protein
MCFWWLCCSPRAAKVKAASDEALISSSETTKNDECQEEFDDLRYLSQKRDIQITIRKGTQAGLAAGLSVMAGVIVAGPVGAAVGGALGTSLAIHMAKDTVPLTTLLERTPPERRGEVIQIYRESFREEFLGAITSNPELKLLLSGGTIFSVVRYMMDRDLLQNEQLERLDGILKKVV